MRYGRLGISILASTILSACPQAPATVFAAGPFYGTWTELHPPAEPFGPQLWKHSVVRDQANQRFIAFGGLSPGGVATHTWFLSVGDLAWETLWTTQAPPERWDHSAIYDPVGQRMIVFGGESFTTPLDDVWQLVVQDPGPSQWTQLAPGGASPPATFGHRAIYDPVGQRMIVYGGFDPFTGNPHVNNLWALSLSGALTWTQLSPSGTPPAPRAQHTFVYDAQRHRAIVHGGGEFFTTFDDEWALDLSGGMTWSEITTAAPRPAARKRHAALFDAGSDEMLVTGGWSGTGVLGDAWIRSYSGSPGWESVPALSVAALWQRQGAALSAGSASAVLHGGDTGVIITNQTLLIGLNPLRLQTEPAPLRDHAMAYDSIDRRIFVFGGIADTSLSGALLVRGTSPIEPWQFINASGPSARYGHSLVFDAADTCLYLFGGRDASVRFADLWKYDVPSSSWQQIIPTGSLPPARDEQTLILDPVGRSLLLMGGYSADLTPIDDLWSLALDLPPQWTQLMPAGPAPSARGEHTAVYDAAQERMLVFGGFSGSVLNTLWAWDLSTMQWQEITPSGLLPPVRRGHIAAYDAAYDRIVVHGGRVLSPPLEDIWSLNLQPVSQWLRLSTTGGPTPGRWGHAGTYDPAQGQFLMHGGQDEVQIVLGDLWSLEWATNVGVPALQSRELSLAASPNPARSISRIAFTLRSGSPVRLSVFDLAGRHVETIVDGELRAGQHSYDWRLRGAGQAGTRAGLYFVRLEAGSRTEFTRLVVLE